LFSQNLRNVVGVNVSDDINIPVDLNRDLCLIPEMFLTLVRRFHVSSFRSGSSGPRRYQFVDALRVYVQGGGGGQGIKKLTAVGGKGGDVYFQGKLNYDLKKLRRQGLSFKAGVGADATKRRILGDAGADLAIPVPLGVTVSDDEGRVIGEINKEGERLLVTKGAPGGGIKNDFVGRKATGIHVRLDLKLLADVGLVGFPNAGKSTLLSRLSRASPRVAAFPFTTLRPYIGVIEFQDLAQISVADLPGLIEGAHRNVGLGHQFLKHVERTKLLLFVVDVNGFKFHESSKPRSPFETVLALMRELELFNPELSHRRGLLCLNKIDSDLDPKYLEAVIEEMRNLPEALANHVDQLDADIIPQTLVKLDSVVAISARDDVGVEDLIGAIRTAVDAENTKRAEKEFDQEEKDYRIDDFTFHLTQKSRNYIV